MRVRCDLWFDDCSFWHRLPEFFEGRVCLDGNNDSFHGGEVLKKDGAHAF
jgi:hypothetical protein